MNIDTYPDQKFTGTVNIVYPTIDAGTRTFPVEITIANPGNKVRPGMFARTTFNLGSKKRVLVPDVAVQKQMGSGDHFVYVYEGGKVRYSKVETGRRIGNMYEIISGVNDKDAVVTSGTLKLADGMDVEVVAKRK